MKIKKLKNVTIKLHFFIQEYIIQLGDDNMNIPFKRGNILLPKNTDMTKWSVVACDQYTSEPEYWNYVEKIVGDAHQH